MKTIIISIRVLFVLTVITGLAYPLIITLLSQTFWHDKAMGSLLIKENKVIGSSLIAQKFVQDKYFHPRPSAVDYGTVPSGASNQGMTNQTFMDKVKKQRAFLGENAPAEMFLSSGSGLDPHISPAAVFFQIERVGMARHVSEQQKAALKQLVEDHIKHPVFGLIGETTVNVLELNLAVDKELP